MPRISVEIDDGVLQALAGSSYFPFECISIEQKAALVLHRWANSTTGVQAPRTSSSSPHLYLSAPIADLVKGLLHGHENVGTALQHGNFGLGTLHMLDGEVVVLDGRAYQQTPDGTCRGIPNDALSPFMMVTRFSDEYAREVQLSGPMDLEALQSALLDTLRTKNVFWAIKIFGTFSYLKCRAVRKQIKDRPLIDVTKEQAIIEWHQPIRGTLVGFFSPKFIGHQLTVPGFHLHFIDESRTTGGHCLGLEIADAAMVTVQIQDLHDLVQEFPRTEAFEQTDFVTGAAEAEKQLKEAEG